MKQKWECRMCGFPEPCEMKSDPNQGLMPIGAVCPFGRGAPIWQDMGLYPPPNLSRIRSVKGNDFEGLGTVEYGAKKRRAMKLTAF